MFSMRLIRPFNPKLCGYLLLTITLLAGGCATVDLDAPKEASYALTSDEAAATSLGLEVQAAATQNPGMSAVHLLSDGVEAFATRLALAEDAERTIDTQYYLITNDEVGLLFITSLLQAADRGVRVRLLLDDILTKGYDAGMAALDSHPNIHIRVFNPWSARGFRAANIGSFQRLNRRMHNKSFTVDNQFTIVGGRNIADEYFANNKLVNFGDLDVLGAGPLAQQTSEMFDTYWNSRYAAPVDTFAKMPDDPAAALEQLRERLHANTEKMRDTQYVQALREDFLQITSSDGVVYEWAPAELAYDSPDKASKKTAATAEKLTTTLGALINTAEQEILIFSPYFVPRKDGEEYFQTLIDRGLKVTVLTNSLAANNHGIVHSGYMGSRKKLLRMGVKLWEVKISAPVPGVDRGGSGAALATLHTKAFMVDREYLFVGSFNWDPRSVAINTESGVIIQSKDLAEESAENIDEYLGDRAYEVVLNDKGKIRWIDHTREDEGGQTVVLDKEPDASWWRRTKAQMGRILPVRGQL
jgi:putative cardiolipin synthase